MSPSLPTKWRVLRFCYSTNPALADSEAGFGRLPLPHRLEFRTVAWRVEVRPLASGHLERAHHFLSTEMKRSLCGSGWAAATSLARVSSCSGRRAIVRVKTAGQTREHSAHRFSHVPEMDSSWTPKRWFEDFPGCNSLRNLVGLPGFECGTPACNGRQRAVSV
jgi:hypothetical protein